jgi:hypothetical protein
VVWMPPEMRVERFDQAIALVQRIGGPEAAREMNRLLLGGYPQNMSGFVEVVVNVEQKEAAQAAAALPLSGATSASLQRCQAQA